jgi:hypothetical protein
MNRRVFLGTLAGGLLAAPLAAETFSGSCHAIFPNAAPAAGAPSSPGGTARRTAPGVAT